MNLKHKINLKEFCREASEAGCEIMQSGRSRCFAVSPREIIIVTTTGAIGIPIENAQRFLRDYQVAVETVCHMWDELMLEEKNQLAKEKGMTYGELQQVMYMLKLGGRNEQENR